MDEIAKREQRKYDLLWSGPSYRECSLGQEFFSHFWDHFKEEIREGELIIDFGCGSGRVARDFLESGLKAHLIDFCSGCLDEEIELLLTFFSDRISFTQACLWDLPQETPRGQWLYCCDVLEHIPEECIDLVLSAMAKRMERGGYISICLQDDLAGKRIGEPLHLTVKEKKWWQEKLSAYFTIEKEIAYLEEVYYNCCVRIV